MIVFTSEFNGKYSLDIIRYLTKVSEYCERHLEAFRTVETLSARNVLFFILTWQH